MSSQHVYAPADICKMFGISKSTLFRWEQEKWFPAPGRDLKGERQYTAEHIRAISETQTRKLSKEYQRAMQSENEADLLQFAEAVSLRKFLAGELTGLGELAEYQQLSAATILQLLQLAMDQYAPDDPMFCRILEVAHKQSCRLSTERQSHS